MRSRNEQILKQNNIVKQRLHYHFASIDGGWIISKNEPFMKEFLNEVSFLTKLCESENVEQSQRDQLNDNITFERTFKNARTNPPDSGGRYWCLIEEQNDLGKSYFQWNCNYHEKEKWWSDNFVKYNVIYWTELAPLPF